MAAAGPGPADNLGGRQQHARGRGVVGRRRQPQCQRRTRRGAGAPIRQKGPLGGGLAGQRPQQRHHQPVSVCRCLSVARSRLSEGGSQLQKGGSESLLLPQSAGTGCRLVGCWVSLCSTAVLLACGQRWGSLLQLLVLHSSAWWWLPAAVCQACTCANQPVHPSMCSDCCCYLLPRRLLSTVRERGMQDILPEALLRQYEMGSWLEDVQEVHRPTSEQQYKRACKGITMRVRGASVLACVREQGRMHACVEAHVCWSAGPPQHAAHCVSGCSGPCLAGNSNLWGATR